MHLPDFSDSSHILTEPLCKSERIFNFDLIWSMEYDYSVNCSYQVIACCCKACYVFMWFHDLFCPFNK